MLRSDWEWLGDDGFWEHGWGLEKWLVVGDGL